MSSIFDMIFHNLFIACLEIHKVMYDLLPAGSYFRFNPFLDGEFLFWLLMITAYPPGKLVLSFVKSRLCVEIEV